MSVDFVASLSGAAVQRRGNCGNCIGQGLMLKERHYAAEYQVILDFVIYRSIATEISII